MFTVSLSKNYFLIEKDSKVKQTPFTFMQIKKITDSILLTRIKLSNFFIHDCYHHKKEETLFHIFKKTGLPQNFEPNIIILKDNQHSKDLEKIIELTKNDQNKFEEIGKTRNYFKKIVDKLTTNLSNQKI